MAPLSESDRALLRSLDHEAGRGRDSFAEMAALSCCDLGCADDPGCACEGCERERPSLWERIKTAFGWSWS